MPRGIRKAQKQTARISTDDLKAGQDLGATVDATLSEIRPPSDLVTRDDIQIVQPQDMKTLAEQEKFMNEFVEIQVDYTSDDPNEPIFLYAGHNGSQQWVRRDEPQRIRRKYLYAMVAGKKTQFACSFGKDQNGNEYNRLNAKTSTTYRIHVLKDTPEGMKKFAEWMREP